MKIMLKLAAIKRIFAEDSITPEERQENLLEVPRVRSHATEKTHARTHPPTYYRDIIVFEKLRFQNVFIPDLNAKPALSNSSGLKSVFEKLRFVTIWCGRKAHP